MIGSKSSALNVYGINHAVPADHVERMRGQRVARQPLPVLHQHRHVLFLIDDERLARAVQVALVIGSAQAKLAVWVQIIRRNADVAGRLDDEQVRRRVAFEFDAIGHAARNHDVVERLERQGAEHGMQRALAVMHEDDFIGVRIAIKLRLRLGGPAARQHAHHH